MQNSEHFNLSGFLFTPFTYSCTEQLITTAIKVGGFNGQLEMYMKKFEDPKQSDPMSRMQNDLDETKIVLVRF